MTKHKAEDYCSPDADEFEPASVEQQVEDKIERCEVDVLDLIPE